MKRIKYHFQRSNEEERLSHVKWKTVSCSLILINWVENFEIVLQIARVNKNISNLIFVQQYL